MYNAVYTPPDPAMHIFWAKDPIRKLQATVVAHAAEVPMPVVREHKPRSMKA